MVNSIICIAVATLKTTDSFKHLSSLFTSAGKQREHKTELDSDDIDRSSESAQAQSRGHLLPLGSKVEQKVTSPPESKDELLAFVNQKVTYILELAKERKWQKQVAMAVLGLVCLAFYATGRLANFLCIYRSGCTDGNLETATVALAQLVGWLLVGSLSAQPLASLVSSVQGFEQIEKLSYLSQVMGLTGSLISLEFMGNLAAKMVLSNNFNCSELGQYELSLFLCGLKALDFATICLERHLATKTEPEKTVSEPPYRQVVYSIANQLFVEGGSMGEVGYAILDLGTDAETFSLLRFNHRIMELLGANKNQSDRSELPLDTSFASINQTEDKNLPHRLAQKLSQMQSQANPSSVAADRETVTFSKLLAEALIDRQSLLGSSDDAVPAKFISGNFLSVECKTASPQSISPCIETHFVISVTVLCEKSKFFLLKMTETQVQHPIIKLEQQPSIGLRSSIISPADKRRRPPSQKAVNFDRIIEFRGEQMGIQESLQRNSSECRQPSVPHRVLSSNLQQMTRSLSTMKLKPKDISKSPASGLLKPSTFHRQNQRFSPMRPKMSKLTLFKCDETGSFGSFYLSDNNKNSETSDSVSSPERSPVNKPASPRIDYSKIVKRCNKRPSLELQVIKKPSKILDILDDRRERYKDKSQTLEAPPAYVRHAEAKKVRLFDNEKQSPSLKHSRTFNFDEGFGSFMKNKSMRNVQQKRDLKQSSLGGGAVKLKKYYDSQHTLGSSLSANLETEKSGANDMIFVYKIIHDLRHPTAAMVESLECLLSESKEHLGQALKIFTKTWHYKKNKNLSTSLKQCKIFLEAYQQKKTVGKMFRVSSGTTTKSMQRSSGKLSEILKQQTCAASFGDSQSSRGHCEDLSQISKMSLHSKIKFEKEEEEEVTSDQQVKSLKDQLVNFQAAFRNISFDDMIVVPDPTANLSRDDLRRDRINSGDSSQFSSQNLSEFDEKILNGHDEVLEEAKTYLTISKMSFPSDDTPKKNLKKQKTFGVTQRRDSSQKFLRYRYIKTRTSQLKRMNTIVDKPQNNTILTIGSDKQLVEILLNLIVDRKQLIQTVRQQFKRTLGLKKQLVTMVSQAQMSMTLLKDLMNQAQLQNNTFTMENEYFDLIKLLRGSLRMVKSQAKEREVLLAGPILDEPSHHVYFRQLYGDLRRYSQVGANFLSNAIKFTKKGGTVSVHLIVLSVTDHSNQDSSSGAESSNESAPDKSIADSSIGNYWGTQQQKPSQATIKFRIVFRDTGVGIPKPDLEKLFQNFSKLDGSKKQNKQGVGLGLSICKEIVLANGGQINVESEEGRGTDFIIDLTSKCLFDLKFQMDSESSLQQSASSDDQLLQESSDSFSMMEMEMNSGTDNLSRVSEKLGLVEEGSLGCSDESDNSGSSVSLSNSSDDSVSKPMTKSRMSRSVDLDLGQAALLEASLSGCPVRCLLANDNAFLLKFFKEHLCSRKIEVDTAEDGLEAVQHFEQQPIGYYSFIILDINMPVMDGIEACKKILEDTKSQSLCTTYIYALTADINPDVQKQIMAAGFRSIFETLNKTSVDYMLSDSNSNL